MRDTKFIRNSNIDDSIPIYLRLQKIISDKIESGFWKPDEVIPTEAEMSKAYNTSVGTVKKSILNLINAGYLYRLRGKGTYVAGTRLAKEQLRYYHFFSNFLDEGAQFQMRLFSLKTTTCPEPIRHLLTIKPNNKVYRMERLSLCDNEPMIYIISRLRKEMFPRLNELPKAHFEKIALYTLLEKKYGIPTITNHELISAVRADSHLSKVLNVDKNEPLLKIEMISFTYKETPYEYRISYCLTNKRGLFRII